MTDIAYAHSAKDLVPGDPEEIRLVAQSWRNRARDYTAMGDKLAMIDLSSAWTGNSGAAAAVRLAGQAAVWRRAGAACLAAADHLDVYASTLEDAQDDARRALQVWKDAEHDRNLRSNVIGPRDPSIDIDSTRQITAKILQSATDSVQTVGDWAADALGEAASAAQVVGQWSNLLGAMIEMELDKVGDNALSLLNAMANHPDIGLGLSAGAGLIALGALGEAGGGALDATGVGALGGVPLGIASVGGFVAGGAAIAAAGTQLAGSAATDSRVDILERNQNRDANGKFAPGNTASADYKLGEQQALDEYEKKLGINIERDEVRAKVAGMSDPDYYRKPDGLTHLTGNEYLGWEYKSGNATLRGQQKEFDELVSPSNPAHAKLPDGTEIDIVKMRLITEKDVTG